VYRLTSENWFDVLGDRTTDALWGIGSKTAKRLAGLGITTVSELAGTDPQVLAAELGPTTGPWLVRIARGSASAVVDSTPHVARSRSRETTFQENLEDWAEVSKLANRVADDVLADGRPATRVVVKVRYAPFFTRTHGRALPAPTTDAHEIERGALAALELFADARPVRLLGVRVEFSR
jgi:DNA polymerase-4